MVPKVRKASAAYAIINPVSIKKQTIPSSQESFLRACGETILSREARTTSLESPEAGSRRRRSAGSAVTVHCLRCPRCTSKGHQGSRRCSGSFLVVIGACWACCCTILTKCVRRRNISTKSWMGRSPRKCATLAKHIVEPKSGHFDPSQFEDHYEAALQDLLEKTIGAAFRSPSELAASQKCRPSCRYGRTEPRILGQWRGVN